MLNNDLDSSTSQPKPKPKSSDTPGSKAKALAASGPVSDTKADHAQQKASPLCKRRSGLRSVGYTYYADRPPKKIVRRQAMSPSQKRKILEVPRLPGQEGAEIQFILYMQVINRYMW